MEFSDYIVYADESGDHGLRTINPQNPVFVLAFCIFKKSNYIRSVVPAVLELKFKFWGHDAVVLHSHDIRKQHGDFNILRDHRVRPLFIDALNQVVANAEFTLVAAAIDKKRLIERYAYPAHPYAIALAFCLERLQMYFGEQAQADKRTYLLVERRGVSEDKDLELEFRRICDGANYVGAMPNLDIRFVDKKHNSAGLQIADLVAYPVARHVIDPLQLNRAYDIVEPKFRRSVGGKILGFGLKIFPA